MTPLMIGYERDPLGNQKSASVWIDPSPSRIVTVNSSATIPYWSAEHFRLKALKLDETISL